MCVSINDAKIINYTPHDVVVVDENGNARETVPYSGYVARAEQAKKLAYFINGIPVMKSTFSNPRVNEMAEDRKTIVSTMEMTPPEDGVYYVVSLAFYNAVKEEGKRSVDDLLITSGAVRDAEGKVIGCTEFGVV